MVGLVRDREALGGLGGDAGAEAAEGIGEGPAVWETTRTVPWSQASRRRSSKLLLRTWSSAVREEMG